MKIIYFTWLFIVTNLLAQKTSVGLGTPQPDASAILDINSSNKGLMLPVVSLTSSSDVTTIPNPKTGFVVYNKNEAGTGNTIVKKGLYVFNGANGILWEKIWTKNDIKTETPNIPFINAVFAASKIAISSTITAGSTQNLTFNILHRNNPLGAVGTVGTYTGYTIQQNGRYVITYATEVRTATTAAGDTIFRILKNGIVVNTSANTRLNLFSGASNSYSTDLSLGDVISFQITVTGSDYQIVNPNVSIHKISNVIN
ncbi:hypothetical protein [Chryseobacterium sp. JM1]|uniref:hypothetical protein n=1 Tax=Chryseobacterium sp. JM1 TaxID=1233950 RepID=UPI0004E6C73F|nr:hypothetical protein [Chryseobacterium sp. JM1]KFF20101.1 hypothetical protein IW22_14380 [Chryseobacterium sp. JM1]